MVGADGSARSEPRPPAKRVVPPEVAGRLAEFTPRVDLTPREVEVLRLPRRVFATVTSGASSDARKRTVKVHLKHIMAKLDVGIVPRQSRSDSSAASFISTTDAARRPLTR